jgi:hypothetical protein
MEFESYDMGGATFCIAGDDGTTTTWVEPPLTAEQLKRTWKETGIVQMEALLSHAVDLSASAGLQGCELRVTAERSAASDAIKVSLTGCAEFHLVCAQSAADSNRIILRVSGHGTRSCGLVGGEWEFAVPSRTSELAIEQEWAWGTAPPSR